MDYHRHTIRLKDFDYSSNGFYFVTICSRDRKCIFGEIRDNKMFLNRNGVVLDKWLLNLENRFEIKIGDYQIMPNHIHMIIKIVGANHDSPKKESNICQLNAGAIRESPVHLMKNRSELSKIIGYLKMNVSKEIGIKIWQRNYFERIIRNEKGYLEVKNYIKLNPLMWYRDRNNPKNLKSII